MNKKIRATSLFVIAIFLIPLIGSVQADQPNRPNSIPVEITLTPGDYVNFYDAWNYNNKILSAKDLTTASWAATLHTPSEDIPFSSSMILNVLIKMDVNLESYVGVPMVPVVGSWGKAVVKATWTIEGDVFEGLIQFKYDYVDALDWRPFGYDEWIPRPNYVECHYYGVLNGPIGQQVVLSGANDAGEFLVNLEGCLKE